MAVMSCSVNESTVKSLYPVDVSILSSKMFTQIIESYIFRALVESYINEPFRMAQDRALVGSYISKPFRMANKRVLI